MFEFPSFPFYSCMNIASFAWKPLHILLSHILHHKPLWTLDLDKCPRGNIGRKCSHKNLECSACMNLDDLHVQVHLGSLLGLHRPTPALTHAFLDHVAGIMNHWKKEDEIGASHRPTQWWRSSIRTGAQGAHGTPSAQLYQFHSELSFPLLSLLLFLSKFIRKRRKRFPSFAFSFAFRVYLLLFARTCLWWYYYPARMVLWCVITHKNDFVECYHPQEWFLWEATMPHKDY